MARSLSEIKTDLPDPVLTDNAVRVLRKRYLKCDEEGNPLETPKDLFWRVASTIAEEDRKYGATDSEIRDVAVDFYDMMRTGTWEPNSPTLFNAGRELGNLSACFVLPVADSMEGIYETLKNMALIHQSGGGTGFSFSRLRQRGAKVKSTNGVASGPVSFMKVYNASTEAVKQGGNRRGANMGILRVDHPDIEEFITCKADTNEVTNFNISVAVTDEFMRAAIDGDRYELKDPRDGSVVGIRNAAEILDKIIEQAHATGEPGLFFIDEANRYNPVPHMGSYESTNPCGEQPLLSYDVCNLGSTNLGNFVLEERHSTDWRDRVDWARLGETEHKAVHFLDNVIDANEFPLPEIRDTVDRIRRVGAGVMGWADMLVKLGISYDSEKAREVAREVSSFVHKARMDASEELAEERGVFPEWEESIWGPDETCARDENGNRVRPMRRLRNCNLDTVAPTGTISIIAGCSGGIEPLYAVAFWRYQAGEEMQDVNDDFKRKAREEGWYTEDLMEKVCEAGTLQEVDEVPGHIKDVFVTAHDVAPKDHIRMQAAWQENIDSAISKTINFPEKAVPEDVREGYELAFELGCKGITVYRDGSREGQALSVGKQEDEDESISVDDGTWPITVRKAPRPPTLNGKTRRIVTPLGTLLVTINEYEGQPFEVIVNLGKAGGAANADAEALGRLISLALRSGVPLDEIYKQLSGISSEQVIGFGDQKVHSVPDGVAQVFEDYLQGDIDPHPNGVDEKGAMKACPDCDATLVRTEGCLKCQSCGFSECG
jgi:ribonucleoside-diphosphate reductase alpha chain